MALEVISSSEAESPSEPVLAEPFSTKPASSSLESPAEELVAAADEVVLEPVEREDDDEVGLAIADALPEKLGKAEMEEAEGALIELLPVADKEDGNEMVVEVDTESLSARESEDEMAVSDAEEAEVVD